MFDHSKIHRFLAGSPFCFSIEQNIYTTEVYLHI